MKPTRTLALAGRPLNTKAKRLVAGTALLLLAAGSFLPADIHAQANAASAQVPAAELTDAEVRKVDLDGGKITLRHAEIKSLDMPPMTMVFVVKDRTLLDKLKAGDKIRFRAIQDAGKYNVTEIRPVP